ncbi:MAG: hypothetical protein GWN01_14560 [Nitrosopumilaceae archaeon]|nr:hypothetical protein [Nitrosopumilaceae archaeon]NIX62680.1 hypothetical protein [Nitrosopumilaceae archaeon]
MIVITRHKALVEYLREIGLVDDETEIIQHCDNPEVIKGKTVIGPVPLHLAALARSIINIPLNIPKELRGQELTLEQVREFAGEPVEYCINVKNHGWLEAIKEEAKELEVRRKYNIAHDETDVLGELAERWAKSHGLKRYFENPVPSGLAQLKHVRELVYLFNLPKIPFETYREVLLCGGIPAIRTIQKFQRTSKYVTWTKSKK